MRPRTTRRLAPQLAPLESRRLLSVTTHLEDGVLTIRGDRSNDVVTLTEDAGRVEVHGRARRGSAVAFAAGDVRQVVFLGGAGNDRLTDDTAIPVRASGGAGNDRLIGGAGNDDLSGDDGNDFLDGRGGDDAIAGGRGNDRLLGEDGDDRLDDHSGRNQLDGGRGSDDVAGGVDRGGGDPGDVNDDHGGGSRGSGNGGGSGGRGGSDDIALPPQGSGGDDTAHPDDHRGRRGR